MDERRRAGRITCLQAHVQLHAEIRTRTTRCEATGGLWQRQRWFLDQLLPEPARRRIFGRHKEVRQGVETDQVHHATPWSGTHTHHVETILLLQGLWGQDGLPADRTVPRDWYAIFHHSACHLYANIVIRQPNGQRRLRHPRTPLRRPEYEALGLRPRDTPPQSSPNGHLPSPRQLLPRLG